jgi:Diacylglycerol acyltransferase
MSLVVFYGRHFLPVPLRRPLHIATADIVKVAKNAAPTSEDIDDVMDRLVASLKKMYEEKKPVWETRPLVIK